MTGGDGDKHESRLRLLPWSGPDGKPCYVSADPDGNGPVSRLADDMEELQLTMAAELVLYSRELGTAGVDPGPQELRYLVARLCESLTDVLRIAHSRDTP